MLIAILFIAVYFVYFAFAMEKTFAVHDEESMRLLIVTIVTVLCVIASSVWPYICPSDLKFRLFDEDCTDPSILTIRAV